MKNTGAFTLLELMVVLAIVSLLIGVGYMGFSRWRAMNRVVQGAQEFGQLITSARAGAKRQNACWLVKISSTGSPTKQYTLSQYTTSSCTATPSKIITYDMPPGTQIQLLAGTNEMAFLPPYGTTDAGVTRFLVSWATKTDWQREVYVTSVLAKVVIK